MARTRIGLDIGATGVRAAEMNMRSIPPALTRVAQVPVGRGAVENGEVKDPAAVGEAIRELWKRGGFRKREVVLGVANARVVVREVTLPWLPDEKEIRASLPFQVQEFVPIPLEDAILDYQVLDEFEKEGRRMLRVLLVAAQKDMIMKIVDAAERARLRPVGLDLIPFAIVRSIGMTVPGESSLETGDEAVVDVGAEVTSICIHAWGVPRFVRILPAGGRLVTTAVAPSVGVSGDEAEQVKRGQLPPGHQEAGHAASAVATDAATVLAEEIQSSIDFFRTKMPGARVSRIVLSGGGSRLEGLHETLRQRDSNLDVADGRALCRVHADLDLDADAVAQAEPLLAVAVGLALPGAHG